MRSFLTNQKGVTIIEGLMALLLLAMVAVGTFGVLLSASRQTAKPDIQEEMILAVERANDLLQIYSFYTLANPSTYEAKVPTALRNALGIGAQDDPLSITGEGESHDIVALLPPICDREISTFTYTVTASAVDATALYWNAAGSGHEDKDDFGSGQIPTRRITFSISCNGYIL